MTRAFAGLAEVQAQLYFQDFHRVLRDLYFGQTSLPAAFLALQKEYDAFIPRCRLRLYTHCRPGYGPVAIHWGLLITLNSSRRFPIAGPPSAVKVPRYLKRPFDPKWVYSIAKRSDLVDRFIDFDRRALALNAAGRAVFSVLRHLKTSTTARFSPRYFPTSLASLLEPGTIREVPGLPVDPASLDLPAEYRQYLVSGWLAAFSLALAEEEGYELVREVSRNPSAEGIRLELLKRNSGSLSRRLVWIDSRTGRPYPRISHRLMAMLGIREAVRPVLVQKEIKRRGLEARLLRASETLSAVHKKCRAAQLILSSSLAEARMILTEAPRLPA